MGLLQGKVVLITGAGNGIGREHALACARAGARVLVNDIGVSRDGTANDLSPAAIVVDEIVALGGDALANNDSVTDPAGCARMVAAALERWGRLDALVNNAGILRDRTFAKMTAREWDPVLEVHLTGTKNMCAAAIPALSKHGGAIVNTSSVSGLIGNFGQANYAAAKAGIYGLTRVLAVELRRAGITANCVAPVAITRMTEDLPADLIDPTWTPDRISPVVVFLASDLAKDVTGRVFGVAGQRIHAYEVRVNEGVTKAGLELWTPEEIAARLDDIFSYDPAPAATMSEGPDLVSAAPSVEPPKTGYPIGKTWDGGYFFARPEHIAAYARATGDLNPAYEGADAIAPPMFHVRLMKALMFRIAHDPELALDNLRLVHGEHAATFHRPIRPWDLVQVRGRLLDVQQKSSGLVVSSGLYAFVEGELAVECRTTYFIRGPAKGEGSAKAAPSPSSAATADYAAAIEVPADASLVYAKASLDDNPIHTDPDVAKAAGLPDIILQGLCTMAFTVREAVRHAAEDDPRRLVSASVRFARPVFNGSTLSTIGWQEPDGRWSVETLGPDGKPVIAQAVLQFRG